MQPNEIFDMMDLARKARANGKIFNNLFVSPPGIGKTEIVQQWAAARGLRCITMTLSSYDPPDFKGFPLIETVDGKQRMDFATPKMWPDDGEGIIVLEEMNRAPTSIMQCLLSLGDSRRGFDGYRLPEGWLVAGCVNPENADGYDTNSMDHALKDRFEIFSVSYDKKVFVKYMTEQKWHKDIINFVEANLWTYKTPEEIGNTPGAKYVSPRTLSKLNTAMEAGFNSSQEIMIYDTILGRNVAKDFYHFRHNESPVSMSDIRKNLKVSLKRLAEFSNPDNYKNGFISITVKDILESDDWDNEKVGSTGITDDELIAVCKTIPVEQSTSLIRDLEFNRKDKELLDRLCKNNSDLKSLFKAVLKYGK